MKIMNLFTEEPALFDFQHVTYMIIVFSLSLFGWIYLGRKVHDEKKQDRIIKISGIALLIALVLNRTFLVIYLKRPFLPQSWCSAIAMFTGICILIFRRNHPVFHYLAPVGMISGLVPTILADYLNEGYLISGCTTILFPSTICGLLYHNLLLFVSVLMLVFGFVKPDIKKWYYFPLGYGLCMLYGVIYMNAMDENFVDVLGKSLNFMNINKPIIAFLDAGWIFFLGFTVYVLFLYVYGVIERKKAGS